jgi:hypothetical protein
LEDSDVCPMKVKLLKTDNGEGEIKQHQNGNGVQKEVAVSEAKEAEEKTDEQVKTTTIETNGNGVCVDDEASNTNGESTNGVTTTTNGKNGHTAVEEDSCDAGTGVEDDDEEEDECDEDEDEDGDEEDDEEECAEEDDDDDEEEEDDDCEGCEGEDDDEEEDDE